MADNVVGTYPNVVAWNESVWRQPNGPSVATLLPMPIADSGPQDQCRRLSGFGPHVRLTELGNKDPFLVGNRPFLEGTAHLDWRSDPRAIF